MATNEFAGEYAGPAAVQPAENVAKGLLFGAVGVLLGIALTAGVWKLGFIASITAWALSAAAVFLYQKGSGGPVVKGRIPLIALIVVGVIVAFFVGIALDASAYYTDNAPPNAPISRGEFIMTMITDPEVIGSYIKELLLFLLFAALGAFGTIRALVSKGKPQAPAASMAPTVPGDEPPAPAPYTSEAPANQPYTSEAPANQLYAPEPQNPATDPASPEAPDQWKPPAQA